MDIKAGTGATHEVSGVHQQEANEGEHVCQQPDVSARSGSGVYHEVVRLRVRGQKLNFCHEQLALAPVKSRLALVAAAPIGYSLGIGAQDAGEWNIELFVLLRAEVTL